VHREEIYERIQKEKQGESAEQEQPADQSAGKAVG
jgi:sRNA-binding carbon storage regulator CsrA